MHPAGIHVRGGQGGVELRRCQFTDRPALCAGWRDIGALGQLLGPVPRGAVQDQSGRGIWDDHQDPQRHPAAIALDGRDPGSGARNERLRG